MKNFLKFAGFILLTSNLSADVKDLYRQHCQVCHGQKGQGGLGSSLVDGQWTYGNSDAEHAEVITRGLPDMGMQGFGEILSDKEIRSLVIYIQELTRQADPAKAPRNHQGLFQTQHQQYRIREVFKNHRKMWGISFLPDDKFIVTEIDGALRIITADGKPAPPVKGTPEIARKGQGGMLDVAVHPDYLKNGWIYLAYAEGSPDHCITTVVRGRIKENTWVDEETIFRADEKFRNGAGVHFGSRIAFREDYVFFSIGDRGRQQHAQNIDYPNGKIFRLHEDGRVPVDNPFVQESSLPAIWSRGHRNPQALAFRPGTDELWSTEHGPRGGDELNRILPGRNYGWPTVTYGMNYNGTPITEHTSLPGLEDPVWHWTPSIATCGMTFADGDVYPGWQGDILAGGLKAQVIERLRIGPEGLAEREVILKDQGRVRDIKTAPDGSIYVILESTGSRLVKIVPEK
ncbi:PQQ-dependent sugar dehydrogenase [Kiritimatiellaeota bacterium B1221]|nr:PQQ-dependent sugar dehydrogenase [Kiritimatiellaeota bacterium B1221]